jgi:uncharacterized membrane protein
VFWFTAALIGQWTFLYYIVAFYGSSALSGDFATWKKNHMLITGYVPGDTVGNLVFLAHALTAATIAFGGVIQMIPWIRSHAPAIHRWNGRVFLSAALSISLAGLYLVWVRHSSTDTYGSVAITGNAALIIASATLAWRAARAGDFDSHRRWALRTFLVANGQWFFRLGVFAWIIVNRGPVGIGEHFDGPFIRFWEPGCYLVPLAVLELYLRAKDGAGSPRARLLFSGGLVALTLLMSVGIAGTYLIIFQPVLARL